MDSTKASTEPKSDAGKASTSTAAIVFLRRGALSFDGTRTVALSSWLGTPVD